MSFLKKLFKKEPQRPDTEDLTPEFSQLVERSRGHLEALTQAHMGAWGLGKADRWDWNQDDGILRFTFADGILAEAPAQLIGSYNTRDKSWLWAGANSSVNDDLIQDALRLHDFGEAKGYRLLTDSSWLTEVEWAHAMTALAVMHCDTQGAYFPHVGETMICLSFGEVKLSRER